PQGVEYVWNQDREAFVCEGCGPQASVEYGALLQVTAAEAWRKRVNDGNAVIEQNWRRLLAQPEVPELIRREIETRLFALRLSEHDGIRTLRRTQALLAQLNDAILFAMATGQIER